MDRMRTIWGMTIRTSDLPIEVVYGLDGSICFADSSMLTLVMTQDTW